MQLLKQLLMSQLPAALATLNLCIERCPDELWNARVGNLAFCQAAFHTLFFTDVYLGPNTEDLRRQAFHRENPQFFRDYEELEDRPQKLMYEKADIRKYVRHCREKISRIIEAETDQTLSGPSGFEWRKCPRGELHVYNMRHIQHHAAQLSLRLRLDAGIDIPWVSSGWREA